MLDIPKIDLELKSLCPPLTNDEYQQLEQNILNCGKCRDAILLWNGFIVDGHNRFCICLAHGIEFKIEEIHFDSKDDAKVWIIDNQLGRRNLCDAARIELVLSKAKILQNIAKNKLKNGGRPHKHGAEKPLSESSAPAINCRKVVANEAGVSEGNVNNYMQIKSHGSPQLIEKVQTGEMKIGTAHRMLPSQINKQLNNVDKMYAYIKKRIPFKDEVLNGQLNQQLGQLKAQLCLLIIKLEGKANEHAS